jgi:hypothetical protein
MTPDHVCDDGREGCGSLRIVMPTLSGAVLLRITATKAKSHALSSRPCPQGDKLALNLPGTDRAKAQPTVEIDLPAVKKAHDLVAAYAVVIDSAAADQLTL